MKDSPGSLLYTNFTDSEVGVFSLAGGGPVVLEASIFPGAVGKAVSAFADSADGKALVVFEGTPGVTDGQLFMADLGAPTADAVLVGTIGDSPRHVRCEEALCLVSGVSTSLKFWYSPLVVWEDREDVPTIDEETTVALTVLFEIAKIDDTFVAGGIEEELRVATLLTGVFFSPRNTLEFATSGGLIESSCVTRNGLMIWAETSTLHLGVVGLRLHL